jgi:hypothetical protein
MTEERMIRIEGLYSTPIQMPFKTNYVLALVKDLDCRLDNDPELTDILELSEEKKVTER